MTKGKHRYDKRPICSCRAYSFPHRVGGLCRGIDFFEFYLNCNRELCEGCNCFNDDRSPISCDVLDGIEDKKEAECYRERLEQFPGEYLPLNFMEYEQ